MIDTPEKVAGDKKRILVVEDTEAISKVLTFRLIQKGFDVCQAFDGEEALEKIGEYSPDLILLDYYLPKLNGDEVCRRIKADERYRNIPVIMCSAAMDEIQDVTSFGADGALLKPYDPEKLIAIIEKNL